MPGSDVFAVDADESALATTPYQLVESSNYEYRVKDTRFSLKPIARVVTPSPWRQGGHDCGSIKTGLHVGLLALVVQDQNEHAVGSVLVEVRSQKLDYQTDYREMLEDIADRCVDLSGDLRSPFSAAFLPDVGRDWESIQQRFFVLKGIVAGRQFKNALHRIIAYPHNEMRGIDGENDIRKGARWSNKLVVQMSLPGRKIKVPKGHPLRNKIGVRTLPARMKRRVPGATEDNPPNQFVKFVLKTFEHFFSEILVRLSLLPKGKGGVRSQAEILLEREVASMRLEMNSYLSSSFFKDVSETTQITLGNPVLQRKGGYREVMAAWIKFQLAAQLTWQGADDVFYGGQKNVAALYEYWCFFQLFTAFENIAAIQGHLHEVLFETSADGFGIKLKAGRTLGPIAGTVIGRERKFRVDFIYNKTFTYSSDPLSEGSWSRQLRPDYTFEIWPLSVTKELAERENLLVRLHFDAKYKINFSQIFSDDEPKSNVSQEGGEYKREDLLKMHAYRDAIRRSVGAYVLYPGSNEALLNEYYEPLPSLGAFALRPGKDVGASRIVNFLEEVIQHLSDRVSLRERSAYRASEELALGRIGPLFNALPEVERSNAPELRRPALPNEDFLVIGKLSSQREFEWVTSHKMLVVRLHSEPVFRAELAQVLAARRIAYIPEARDDVIVVRNDGVEFRAGEHLIEIGYPEPLQATDVCVVIRLEAGSECSSPNVTVEQALYQIRDGRRYTVCSMLDLLRSKQ